MPYCKGCVCSTNISGFDGFGSCFKNPMFLTNKSPRGYVGLYQKFLYESFSLLLTSQPPPNHYSHNFPDVTTAEFGTMIILLCDPQEDLLVCSAQCAFPKCAAIPAIGQSPCDKSIPSDTPRTFIQRRFILFSNRSQGDLPLFQKVSGRVGGGYI